MTIKKFERKKEPQPVVQRQDRDKEKLTHAMQQIMAKKAGKTVYEPIDATPEMREHGITTNQYLSIDELYDPKYGANSNELLSCKEMIKNASNKNPLIANNPDSFFHSTQINERDEAIPSAELASKIGQ